ncbi:thymidylate synthase [Streptomyces sp. NPDC004111]|uniref:thymidylate synthase n=1 Tax=Streptomyces sp. NPDC004111 TaxID=3364690 RepID=UPI003682F26E
MLTPPIFPSFEQAYLEVLDHICGQYQYRNAPRGNAARECLGLSFQISNPRERLPYLAARRVNPAFHFAEALWFLAGRNDLDMIAYYAPRMRHSSADGYTVGGSAYGSRIFNPQQADSTSPFEHVMDLLRTEKDSKRGLLPIFTADELGIENNADMSCAVALHLLEREGKLHMVCYMRANDCDRGLLSDVFSFTMIQEFAAVRLGLQLGTYTHHIGSAHVGDRDFARVLGVLEESVDRPTAIRFPFPEMPATTDFSTVEAVLVHEEKLRRNEVQYQPDDIVSLGFDPYWQQVLLLFEVYRQVQYCRVDPVDVKVLRALNPGLRWLMASRWPFRVEHGVTG